MSRRSLNNVLPSKIDQLPDTDSAVGPCLFTSMASHCHRNQPQINVQHPASCSMNQGACQPNWQPNKWTVRCVPPYIYARTLSAHTLCLTLLVPAGPSRPGQLALNPFHVRKLTACMVRLVIGSLNLRVLCCNRPVMVCLARLDKCLKCCAL